LIFTIFLGCQNDQDIEGNYSICHKGEYVEVYFKKDSIRFASDDEWIKLSDWRKNEIKKDTLHFETFGEWRDSLKAVIKFVGVNGIKMRNLTSGENLYLEPIDENINFENPKEFWEGFYNRQNSGNCTQNNELDKK